MSKVKRRVWRTHTQISCTLNWPKQISGDQDTHFCLNVCPICIYYEKIMVNPTNTNSPMFYIRCDPSIIAQHSPISINNLLLAASMTRHITYPWSVLAAANGWLSWHSFRYLTGWQFWICKQHHMCAKVSAITAKWHKAPRCKTVQAGLTLASNCPRYFSADFENIKIKIQFFGKLNSTYIFGIKKMDR